MSIQLKVYSSNTQLPATASRKGFRARSALQPKRGGRAMSTNQPAAMLITLALMLLFYGSSKISCSTPPDNSTDVLSLLAFKAANDPTGVLSSWKSGTNHCLWKGVNCSRTHPGRVTALELGGSNLAGSISPSLGNLTFLRILDLSANGLSGKLPPLNHLRKLELLNLSSNLLLSVSDLTNSSNLRYLDLYSNNLTGTIPPNLSNITTLERIDLRVNQLIGSIPQGFGKLPNISYLFLGQNKLVGEIPLDLFNLSSLRKLDLETNMLTGALTFDIGENLSNIEEIYLGDNMLKGPIPPSLGNASRLSKIDLSYNNFGGQVPISIGKLSLLKSLNLDVNYLEASDNHGWEFINSLSSCKHLEMLSLYQINLQGLIPSSIGNLSTHLQELYLGSNGLSGKVPPSIGNLHQLYILKLGNNSLSGTIGGWIGNLTQLQVLGLKANNFVGKIPSAVFNFTQLKMLILANNKFEGPISSSLGNLNQLLQLDLSSNNLDGKIPLEVSNLQQLSILSLQSNKLSGEIPDGFGQSQNLIIVEMDQNSLTGNITTSFGNLKQLEVLNLSHNSLSGTIPSNLGDLATLTVLDLSYNDLQGAIPTIGVFQNATIVSLNGNLELCGGPMDFHMPPCSPISHRVEKRNYLIKVLIPIFGLLSLVLLIYLLFLEKKMSRKNELSLTPFDDQFVKVSYQDVAQATRDFSDANLIGRGSCGIVYRGRLKETKMEVAVKVFNLEMRGADKSFFSECEALRSIQHRNLLPIITACSTVDNKGDVFKALIYEFMPNGSLDTWLHSLGVGKDSRRLGLAQIISIAVNIADALDYLHHECGRPTVHCDIKPSNILLDDDMNALLGDFGIARFYLDSQLMSQGSTCSTGMKGTIGYIAPEYVGGGHASAPGDVYSFGIVLLEMLTGKRPTDPMFKDGVDIVNFVTNNFPHQILRVVDARVIEEFKDLEAPIVSQQAVYEFLGCILQVALSCTRPLPRERMDMKQVVSRLHRTSKTYLEWKAKK